MATTMEFQADGSKPSTSHPQSRKRITKPTMVQILNMSFFDFNYRTNAKALAVEILQERQKFPNRIRIHKMVKKIYIQRYKIKYWSELKLDKLVFLVQTVIGRPNKNKLRFGVKRDKQAAENITLKETKTSEPESAAFKIGQFQAGDISSIQSGVKKVSVKDMSTVARKRDEKTMVNNRKKKINMVDVETKPVTPIEDANEGTETGAIDNASDFQKEIFPLSFDKFITETNIVDLLKADHRKKFFGKDISAKLLRQGLKFYYDLRLEVNKWGKSIMKNLKFNICGCKRNKVICADAFTQVSSADLSITPSQTVRSLTTQFPPNGIVIAEDPMQSASSVDPAHSAPLTGRIEQETNHTDSGNESCHIGNMNNLSQAGSTVESISDSLLFSLSLKRKEKKSLSSTNQQTILTTTGRNKLHDDERSSNQSTAMQDKSLTAQTPLGKKAGAKNLVGKAYTSSVHQRKPNGKQNASNKGDALSTVQAPKNRGYRLRRVAGTKADDPEANLPIKKPKK